MLRPSFVEVDLQAIGRNVRTLKKAAAKNKGCLLMAVVKANAYGHGAIPVSEWALRQGADWLGVALPQEALELRDAGISAPILVMGYSDPASYKPLVDAGVRMAVYTRSQGEAIAAVARETGREASIHLKVDTGMGRIGFWPDDQALRDIMALAAMEGLELEGCFTHFARADEDDEASWRAQFRIFLDFLGELQKSGIVFPIAHCANTAAGMRDEAALLNMYRTGIGVYGLYPSEEAKAWGLISLEPALSWKSILSHVKWLPQGCGVGYGHIWVAQKDTLVGTVPLGYADGFSKALNNKGRVLVRGKKLPVIGRVCMDQFMVDLTAAPDACPGDEVVLIGRQGDEEIGADELAALAGTNCYEIVNTISARVPRRYLA
jgi:alanine racemase